MNEKELLQIELANIAARYRSAAPDSVAHHQVLKSYYLTFEKLVKLNGGILALDPDAELPDRLMPKAYVDFWLKGNDY